jgi:hypothetical protein
MKSGYYEASKTISLAGLMSNVETTTLSGLLELIQQGDDIMAENKGFTIKKILEEKGATLNIPNFYEKQNKNSV